MACAFRFPFELCLPPCVLVFWYALCVVSGGVAESRSLLTHGRLSLALGFPLSLFCCFLLALFLFPPPCLHCCCRIVCRRSATEQKVACAAVFMAVRDGLSSLAKNATNAATLCADDVRALVLCKNKLAPEINARTLLEVRAARSLVVARFSLVAACCWRRGRCVLSLSRCHSLCVGVCLLLGPCYSAVVRRAARCHCVLSSCLFHRPGRALPASHRRCVKVPYPRARCRR